jgi:tetratricopeptide (TPR) repeat protein
MIDQTTGVTGARRRAIRVFVSSTFRDMHAERDELVKRAFPQVRKLCERRGVAWAEVDLRWGVTDEQKSEGKVLGICLAEIQNCRPFFIGLLGQRYGWVPETIPPELVEGETWLTGQEGRSVTELEILHGVLNDPEMAGHAFFYLRDPSYLDRLPPGANRGDFISEGPASAAKLARLKDHIRASGFPVREGYRDPRALADLVLSDLVAMVDRLYPAGSEPDPLDREEAEHEAFARARAQVYIARSSYFLALDEHVAGAGAPLVVRGESGSGKSSLLANWALRHREEATREILLMHFVGATPESTDAAALLRRIMGELKRRLDLPREIPDRADQVQEEFADWLAGAAERGRVVLIIDALNQLEDRDGALDLAWLPRRLPADVRLIVSTLPGRSLDELARRGWPSLSVEPLRPGERETLIVDYLRQYSKALSPRRVQAIVAAGPTANPLYLRALLEELRLFGVHERLDERLAYYLAAPTLEDLYARILDRYEVDHEQDRPGLVREAMSLLWASRRGLREAELLELLGRRGVPLPRAHWAPLALAADSILVSRSGLLGFAHDYIREAVRTKYLPRERDRRRVHRRLADDFERRELGRRRTRTRLGLPYVAYLVLYLAIAGGLLTLLYRVVGGIHNQPAFELLLLVSPVAVVLVVSAALALWTGWGLAWLLRAIGDRVAIWSSRLLRRRAAADPDGSESESPSPRGVDELPWQLARAGDWWRLYDLLRLLPFFRRAWEANPFQVRAYWRDVEVGTYGVLGRRLARTPELDRAFRDVFGGRILDAYRRVLADPLGSRGAIAPVAQLLAETGHHRESSALVDRLIRHDERRDDTARLAAALVLQADGFRAQDYSVAALAAYTRAERLCRASGDARPLARCLDGRAAIALERGDLDDALARSEEAERIGRDAGDDLGRARTLITKAKVLRARGEPAAARDALRIAERLARALGSQAEWLRVLDEQRYVSIDLGDDEAAQEAGRRAALLRAELGAEAVPASPVSPGEDLDARLAALRRDERAYRRSGQRSLLAQTLAEQAYHWAVLRRFPLAAKPVAREAARLARRRRLEDLLQELQPVLDATAPTVEELARDAVGHARPAIIWPLVKTVAFGAAAACCLILAVCLAASDLLGGVQAAGLWAWLCLLIGIPFAAVAARNLQALLIRPYLIMTPQGLAVRHWRLKTESEALRLVAAILSPIYRPEYVSVAWSEFRGCRADRKGFALSSTFIIETAEGERRIGRVFHQSPLLLVRAIRDSIQEVERSNGDGARGPFRLVGEIAPQTSGLAVASLTVGIASYLCLYGIGGLLAVILGHGARKAIRTSDGLLSGAKFARWGLILGYTNALIFAVLLIIFLMGRGRL